MRAKPESGSGTAWLARAGVAATAVPVVRAAASGAKFAVRAAREKRGGVLSTDGVPTPAATPLLAASVALDELFLQTGAIAASAIPKRHYERSSRELDRAVGFYDEQGWLDDSAGYFDTPPPLREVRVSAVPRRKGALEVLRFDSGWEPRPDEPGRDRWVSFGANREVPATILRHPGEPRPWLVCLHGQNMGRLSDIDSLRVRHLHHDLGLNLMLPVLPLHGARRSGFGFDQQFVSNVYPVNNVLGLGQAIWDLRRLFGWLRDDQGAPCIGLFGLSLGSYVASLLASLDGNLACVIAVVPNGDLASAMGAVEPITRGHRRAHHLVHGPRSALAHQVVSPLVRPCRVPVEHRFVVAGQGDRIATAQGAVMLWRHWEQSEIDWHPRGHLTTPRSTAYDDQITDIVRRSGLATVDPLNDRR